MIKKQHNLVNWIEGMPLKKVYMEQLEDHFIEAICDNLYVRMNKNNYGLLPASNGQIDSSEFDISERITGQVEIKLRRCNALTAGGYRINYNPPASEFILYTHSFSEEKEINTIGQTKLWDIIITADPYGRIPSGLPNEEANPPHQPDKVCSLKLSVLPKGEIDLDKLGHYHLVIGRIRYQGNRHEVDTNFIPPCTIMGSHQELIRYYEQFGGFLNDIERASKLILSKVRNRSQNSTIAGHMASLCEDIMRYIAHIYFSYRNEGLDNTPSETVNYFSTLAHICYSNLNFISKTDKEELLKYFYEWSDITPGSFDELLVNTLSVIYEHYNIRSVMLQVNAFLRIMSELWLKLSTLEYIGQHKENIVVSERSYQSEQPKRKGGWSVID